MTNEDQIEEYTYLRGIEILLSLVALEKTINLMRNVPKYNTILSNVISIILQAIATPSVDPLVCKAGVSLFGRHGM